MEKLTEQLFFSDSENTLVLRVFLKSVELLGGMDELLERGALGWLQPLAKAAYCLVGREEYFKSEEELAQKTGLTLQTVRNLLRAETAEALQKLKNRNELFAEEKKELKINTAGSITKLAYRLVKDGQEEGSLLLHNSRQTAHALDVTWADLLLRRLRISDFPISSPEGVVNRLEGLYIRGRSAAEVLKELDYPIRTPTELLLRVRENLRMYGLD